MADDGGNREIGKGQIIPTPADVKLISTTNFLVPGTHLANLNINPQGYARLRDLKWVNFFEGTVGGKTDLYYILTNIGKVARRVQKGELFYIPDDQGGAPSVMKCVGFKDCALEEYTGVSYVLLVDATRPSETIKMTLREAITYWDELQTPRRARAIAAYLGIYTDWDDEELAF